MAKLSINGFDGLELSLEELANLPDELLERMLLAEAAIVEREQKARGRSYGVHRTGVTLDSITHGKMKTQRGGRTIYVYPRGTNADGNRNAEVAFINEYGKDGQAARPFIRDANEAAAAEATDAAEDIYHKWLDDHNL